MKLTLNFKESLAVQGKLHMRGWVKWAKTRHGVFGCKLGTTEQKQGFWMKRCGRGLWTQKGLSQLLGQSQEVFCLSPMALVHGCGAVGELLAQSGPRIIFCLFYISTCFVFYSFLFCHLSCCQTRAEFLLQSEESAKQPTCWHVGSRRPPGKDILRDRGLIQSQQIR